MTYTLTDLEAALDRVPAKDQNFARDLIRKGRRFGLTEKQEFWVNRLTQSARGELQPKTVAIGDLAAVIALFDKAKRHLKYPKISVAVFEQPYAEALVDLGNALIALKADPTAEVTVPAYTEVRLSVAGEAAKVPGSITVTSLGRFGSNTWYGRITKEGVFQPSADAAKLPRLAEALQAFALDPAGVASHYGKLTSVGKLHGNCCFCLRALDDPKSTEVGYGPICAEHYDLPWGTKRPRKQSRAHLREEHTEERHG